MSKPPVYLKAAQPPMQNFLIKDLHKKNQFKLSRQQIQQHTCTYTNLARPQHQLLCLLVAPHLYASTHTCCVCADILNNCRGHVKNVWWEEVQCLVRVCLSFNVPPEPV
jgi:hypothetical protein